MTFCMVFHCTFINFDVAHFGVFARNGYLVSIGVWHHVALSTLSHTGYQARVLACTVPS